MNASEKSAIVMLTLGDVPGGGGVQAPPNAHEVKHQCLNGQHGGLYSRPDGHGAGGALRKTPADMRRSASTPTIICAARAGQGAGRRACLLAAGGSAGYPPGPMVSETLNFMDPQAVFDLISGEEHPQIIATILVHLKRKSGRADVLSKFDERT